MTADDPEGEGDAAAGSRDSSSDSEVDGGTNVIEDEDEFDDVADAFESSYNFRFEEPYVISLNTKVETDSSHRNATEIARHPRNLTFTVRRQDTTRKEARERRKARKEEELLQKREEVKRLKALKMKELRRKLERIGKEGGLEDIDKHQGKTESSSIFSAESPRVVIIALQDLDLEGDWDPDAHDRQMTWIYAQDDDEEFNDGEKPTWNEDIDIDDILPPTASSSKMEKKSKKDKKKGKKSSNEDKDYEMGEGDEAYGENGEWDDEEWDGTEEMRKRKLQEYMDSLFELEFNDVVSATRSQYCFLRSYHPSC